MSSILKLKFILVGVLLPILIWAATYHFGKAMIDTYCATSPQRCTIESVNAFDRISFSFHSKAADHYSTVIQDVIVYFLFLFPFILAFFRRISWITSMRLLTYYIAIALWNGAIFEFAKFIFHRPRPLVYVRPLIEGADPHQYNSFYSGHTSFVAAAWVALVFTSPAWNNGKKSKLFQAFGFFSVILVASLRVLGGRHFPTDTLGAIVAGGLLSWAAYKEFYLFQHS